jgi:F-type H+-transporting ATPase subunit gamma
LEVDEQKPNHLMVLVSSDRGLCGGVHSSLAKAVKAAIAEQPSSVNTMLVPCGDKARTILQKTHGG